MKTKDFVFANVKALANDATPNGSFEAVISAPSVDRDGEIIDPGAFNPLPKSIPILADHDGKIRSLVGSAQPFYDGDLLKVKGEFSSVPEAQDVRTKLAEGHLGTMSVGFMPPLRTMKDGIPHITRAELLEASFVVIPSNRDALVSSVKQYADIEPVAGSFEETQEDLREYLGQLYRSDGTEAYVSLLATFTDHVVYSVERYPSTDADGTFAINYSMGEGDDNFTFGIPTPVEVEQVVSPKRLAHLAIKAGRRNSSKDQVNIQAAHDAIVAAGASCEPPADDGGDDAGKSAPVSLSSLEAELLEMELS